MYSFMKNETFSLGFYLGVVNCGFGSVQMKRKMKNKKRWKI